MTAQVLTFEYELSAREIKRGGTILYWALFPGWTKLQAIVSQSAWGLGALVLGMLFQFKVIGTDNMGTWWGLALYLTVTLGIFWIVIKGLAKPRDASLARLVNKPHKVTCTPVGMDYSYGDVQMKTPWTEVTGVSFKKGILAFSMGGTGVLVPAHALGENAKDTAQHIKNMWRSGQ